MFIECNFCYFYQIKIRLDIVSIDVIWYILVVRCRCDPCRWKGFTTIVWLKNEGQNICLFFVKNQNGGLISHQSPTIDHSIGNKLVLQQPAYRPWIGRSLLPHLEVCRLVYIQVIQPKVGRHIFIWTSFTSLSWVRPDIGNKRNQMDDICIVYSKPTYILSLNVFLLAVRHG